MKRIIALLLAAAVLLCGCGATNSLGYHGVVSFDEMEYTRPDMAQLEQILQDSCDAAAEGKNIDTVVDGIWEFYDAYDAFYTNYNLAYIHYSADMGDYYWQTENDYCAEKAATVDAMLEELYYALADSPLREELEGDEYFGEGYFDYYDEGESVYDEVFVGMLEQESALVSDYYDLYYQSMEGEYYTDAWFEEWSRPMGQILVDLIEVRQEIAAYAGYDSYPEFAYDSYYYRDYTWQEAAEYLDEIRTELVPVYRRVNQSDVWDSAGSSSQRQTFAYVRVAAKAMGGTVAEAFDLMSQGELYDITISDTKSGSSFEVFLTGYYQPYIFTSPDGSQWDQLTFAHEFGHFVKDYATAGGYAGMDVEEFFSQGMEYLSLCYSGPDETLERMKMADCICTYVEQAAYAEFEHRMYELTGGELTVEKLFELYEEVCLSFGFDSFDWDSRDFVTVPHFYEQPLYVISYVVSNDAALQLYQLEQEESGAGLARFEENLLTEEYYFLSFVESAGLESPFAPGRVSQVRQTMESIFAVGKADG